jgi:GDPmannose 4,6-dehydratase
VYTVSGWIKANVGLFIRGAVLMFKKAFITGITGQDGSYLAELLLSEGYAVYGLYRRKSKLDYGNVDHLINKITFIEGDLTDQPSLLHALKISQPDEVYNLAAQSYVGTSFSQPFATTDINGLGVLNLLEAIRDVKPDTKLYQASTSELYGGIYDTPCDEDTPFYPRSPYAAAKLYAHWITKNYRESYGMYACAGILFNHESERRGKEFVTRKITSTIGAIKRGEMDVLELGNLSAKRDWGHAADYVRAMHLMLLQDKADEYVISTGEAHTVREFAKLAFSNAGYDINFEGEGVNEKGVDIKSGKVLVRVNPVFFRPSEVNVLIGNPAKAKRELGWRQEIGFGELVRRMVENDVCSLCV